MCCALHFTVLYNDILYCVCQASVRFFNLKEQKQKKVTVYDSLCGLL